MFKAIRDSTEKEKGIRILGANVRNDREKVFASSEPVAKAKSNL